MQLHMFVYSGNIKNPGNTLETRINEYKVNSISMADKDGDKIYIVSTDSEEQLNSIILM